jgi:ABC-type nitrate/sulfonate/bicarbonate transport system substrate-binding protein
LRTATSHGHLDGQDPNGDLVLGKGELAQSNADQVAKIVRILKELSLDIATPDEARQMLQLKGADRVGF